MPFERRVGRFLEILEICQALWRRDGVSFHGKHFTLEDVTMEPKPHRAGGPPIWIGGSGPIALREAARFDAWFPTGPSVEFFAEQFPRIQAAARAAGRPADAVTGAAYVTLALDPSPAAAEKRLHGFLEHYYSAPAAVIMKRQATYAGPVEGCVEWLRRWIASGARHISLRFAGGDQLAQVDEVASRHPAEAQVSFRPTMTCSGCGHGNPEGVRFCGGCGARLDVVCASCQAPNPPGNRFCHGAAEPSRAEAAPGRFASPQAYTPKHLAEKILTTGSALEGERKQVTVLFVDVSGFTSLSERLDPEDVHRLMSRAFELMLAEVHRYEGTVNQFLGDGIMALFGAPIAHEDHARRAVHAALGIARALEGYQAELAPRGISFRARQGLNTGLVVVGSIGSDLRMDYTAVGDTTNVAARLQQAGEPGRVTISEATHRLVRGYFETRPLGALHLKGKTESVAAWEVVAAHETRTRLEVEADRGLTPFVGRERELRLAGRRLRARAGRPGAGRLPRRRARASASPACSSSCAGGSATARPGRRVTACRSGRPWHSTRWWTFSSASSASRRPTARRPSPRRSSAA